VELRPRRLQPDHGQAVRPDTYVKPGPGRIGSRYIKCLYRGYTDATFRHLQQRSQDEAYLGFLGPVIRAQVGDSIRVVFHNGCRFAASVHPHGVFYAKNSEGAPYADDTKGGDKADDAVPPGGRHTYVWDVPGRAGPGPGDGSSVMWMYHSHTHEVADTYAGLIGPIEITARGMARPDGSPKDVDREVFALFSVMNENQSPYLQASLHRFASPPYPKLDDEDFNESNLMHSINGYVFGNEADGRMTRPACRDEGVALQPEDDVCSSPDGDPGAVSVLAANLRLTGSGGWSCDALPPAGERFPGLRGHLI